MTPKILLVFSGKRKSGKDYLTEKLTEKLGCDMCQILRLSGPLKKQYAMENGLNFEKLSNASSYKEEYRAKMIKWGEEKRLIDPYFFCQKTIEMADSSRPVWIISDARRLTDVRFFRETYPGLVKFVRITASLATRQSRGFVFTKGIDDAESECGLDSGVNWDYIITNDSDGQEIFRQQVNELVELVREHINR